MMKSEFDNLLGRTSPADDYKIIEFVYTYHPCNFDKKAVAKLYNEFGLVIFKDLYDRANAARDLEEKINVSRKLTEDYLKELKELSN